MSFPEDLEEMQGNLRNTPTTQPSSSQARCQELHNVIPRIWEGQFPDTGSCPWFDINSEYTFDPRPSQAIDRWHFQQSTSTQHAYLDPEQSPAHLFQPVSPQPTYQLPNGHDTDSFDHLRGCYPADDYLCLPGQHTVLHPQYGDNDVPNNLFHIFSARSYTLGNAVHVSTAQTAAMTPSTSTFQLGYNSLEEVIGVVSPRPQGSPKPEEHGIQEASTAVEYTGTADELEKISEGSTASSAEIPRSKAKKRVAVRHFCSICSSSFPRPSGLEMHMRRHDGSRPFVCPQCDRSFSVRSNLKRHLFNTHGVEAVPEPKHRSVPYSVGFHEPLVSQTHEQDFLLPCDIRWVPEHLQSSTEIDVWRQINSSEASRATHRKRPPGDGSG